MAKTKYIRKYKIPILHYDYWVTVFICDCGTTIKQSGHIFEFSDTRGKCYFTTADYHAVIFVDRKLPKHQFAGTLAHEAAHAVDSIMDYSQINDTEFRGQCVGAIVSAVLEKEWGKKC